MTIQHHYRGDKMALWLHLIPRIHRPDGFDPRYHLLDDYTNQSTFEEDEPRREIDPTELLSSTTTTTTTIEQQVAVVVTSSQQTTSRRDVWWTSRSRKSTTTARQPLLTVWTTKDRVHQDGSSSPSPSSVGLTVVIGLSLLCLNLVVFAAVYCQWMRLRSATKAVTEGDEDFRKSSSAGDSEYVQDAKQQLDPTDSTPNDIIRYLSEKRAHRTTFNDRRYKVETLPLKARSEECAVMERNTLPKKNCRCDRVSFEGVSPSDFKAAQQSNIIVTDSSTLV